MASYGVFKDFAQGPQRIFASIITASFIMWGQSSANAGDIALDDAVSMAGMQIFLNSRPPALIIGVIDGDNSVIKTFGETKPGSGIEPDGQSIFRIASVSKVFAGDVLAGLAAKGKVQLTDPLQKYASANTQVQSNGRPVTLLDLATHTGGLQRELPDPDTRPSDNPFQQFDGAYYWKWISDNKPAYRPGTTTLYSNFGYGLLGDALGRAGGSDYETVLDEEVIKPAGLTDTTLKLSDAQKPRLMTGLDPFGKPDGNFEAPDIMQASAGIYTTADDMMRWMRWHLDGVQQSRPEAVLAHTLWLPYDGLDKVVGTEITGGDGMGLGWVVTLPKDNTPLLLGKSGGIGGFMTYVVISPNRRLAIFVNASQVNFAMFENIRSTVRELAAELAR